MVNLVHLTIDNKPITVPAGTTILEAAEHNGIPIPKLCYLKEDVYKRQLLTCSISARFCFSTIP